MKMKKIVSTIAVSFLLSGFSGCASKPENLAQKTVVVYGEKSALSADKRITYLPAGEAFPMTVKIGGDIFTEEKTKRVMMHLKEDAYIYMAEGTKDAWISADKKMWEKLSDGVKGTIFVGAGYDKEGSFEGRFGLVVNGKK